MLNYITSIYRLYTDTFSVSRASKRISQFEKRNPVKRNPHAALTLIEMLIGMAITLVMMAAVVNLFANMGAGVRVRRAGMEMNSELRLARSQLYKDLAGATCAARPKLPTDDHSDGYIEIIEGQWSDHLDPGNSLPSSLLLDADGNGEPDGIDVRTSLVPSSNDPDLPNGWVTDGGGLGDYDDILALTVRSPGEPFVGRRLVLREGGVASNVDDWVYETIQSDLAEVIWFAVENPADGSLGEPGMRTVYRRVLLIAPWVGNIDLSDIPRSGGGTVDDDINGRAKRFFQRFDISARYDSVNNVWVANTLSDLCKRENRFAHFYNVANSNRGFPHYLRTDNIRVSPGADLGSPLHPFGDPWFTPDESYDDPERTGDDIMLSNALGFDLRVYDPGAPQYLYAGVVVEPADVGWREAHVNGLTPVGYGGFADLYWNRTTTPMPVAVNVPDHLFDEISLLKSQLTITSPPALASVAYDTWSFHYENDGIDQDGDGLIDEGTNGLDDDGINGTDDIGERETSPPYNVPLRGIQAKLRIYEPATRQIREATVTRNMVPE